jgi:hypothetical protein
VKHVDRHRNNRFDDNRAGRGYRMLAQLGVTTMSDDRPLSAGLLTLLAGVMLSGTGLVCFVVGGHLDEQPAPTASEPSVSSTAADPVMLLPAGCAGRGDRRVDRAPRRHLDDAAVGALTG